MNQITGFLLCSGKQVPKKKRMKQSKTITFQSYRAEIQNNFFPKQPLFIPYVSHRPLLSTHQVLFQANQLGPAQPCQLAFTA